MTDWDSGVVRKNYSRAGVSLIEGLYGTPGFLSPGGLAATDRLADHAQFSEADHVLDVGSGLGGPALRLVERFRCRVTGLELVESSVTRAAERARTAGREHLLTFECGDALQMPFPNIGFSAVWSQDAWCHIPDRAALLGEVARVLQPGGRLIFSDWVHRTGELNGALLDALAAPDLAAPNEYLGLLHGAGFGALEQFDLDAQMRSAYLGAMDRLNARRQEIVEQFDEGVFGLVLNKNQLIADAIAAGRIGSAAFSGVLTVDR